MPLSNQEKLAKLARLAEADNPIAVFDRLENLTETTEKLTEKDTELEAEIAVLAENHQALKTGLETNFETHSKGMSQLLDNKASNEQLDAVQTTLEGQIKAVELIPGPKGDDYVLTPQDKTEIASKIKVPIVEKIVERTEVIKEPIVKEVAVTDKPEVIRDKLSALEGEDRLDALAIKNLPRVTQQIGTRAGWGAHPLQIRDGNTVIDKVARIINFGDNLTATRGVDGVITVSASSGTIIGADTQVLFFDGANNPAGDSKLTFNKTAGQLSITSEFGDTLIIDGSQLSTADATAPYGIAVLVGNATSGNNNGGNIGWYSGQGFGSGHGGDVVMVSGAGGLTGDGGDFSLAAGQGGGASGGGGLFQISGGNATAGNSNGGDVSLLGGAKSGSGTKGKIKLKDGGSTVYAILDTATLATSDKTFTFPNASGTIALVAGSDTQVLFNDGGALGGDAGLVYNKTTDTLTTVVGAFRNVTITGTTDITQLVVKSHSTQTSNPFEMRNSADGVILSVNQYGGLYSQDVSAYGVGVNGAYQLLVYNNGLDSRVGMAINTPTSQTANIFEWQKNSIILSSIDKDGNLTLPNTGLHLLDTNASHDLIIKPGSDLTADKTLTITTGDADVILNLTAVTDEYVLAYDTATNTWRGVVSAAGAPGGSTTQLQYNNAGAFGGTSGVTWNGTNLLFATTQQMQFRDTGQYINSKAVTELSLTGATTIKSYIGSTLVTTVSSLEFDIGSGGVGVDYTLGFLGETNNGAITWMEDEDYFSFADDVFIPSTEKIYFRATGQSIYSSAVDTLDLDAVGNTYLRFGGVSILRVDASSITIGAGQAGVDYQIFFSGESSTGSIKWDEDLAHFLLSGLALPEVAAPGTPTTGRTVIYVKTDGKVYAKDDVGTEYDLTSGGGVPTTITVANEATDTSCFPLFVTAATGDLGPKTNANLIYNSNTGALSIGTSASFTTGTIELGAASDTTLSRSAAGVLAVEGVVIPSISSINTLTNKRINPRLTTATSYTTDTGTSLNIANCDQFEVTAQAGALLFNSPGGTPVGGNKLIIRIKDNGTARSLTYNAIFRAMGVALPTTTVLSKTLYMGFIYNATDSKWDLVAASQES